MALPKIDLPIFELELPSTGEKIKYRPFTVKEEKIFLIAQESKEAQQEVLAVKQVVNNCLIDHNVDNMPMFDLEYVMLVLRSKSVNNVIEFLVTDPETEEKIELSLDIEQVIVEMPEKGTEQVKINEDYSLFLKYPSINEYAKIVTMDSADPLINYTMMVSCLDKVASDDEVFNFAVYTDNEIRDFVDGLSTDVIKGIQNFFEKMPKLRHEMKYTNKEGKEQTFVVEGMRSFFI
jgi:hypothetical protein|tara:strand:- start:145 stop:846 length:702 start_codon:yes stop_codon:yes gene_type:complete